MEFLVSHTSKLMTEMKYREQKTMHSLVLMLLCEFIHLCIWTVVSSFSNQLYCCQNTTEKKKKEERREEKSRKKQKWRRFQRQERKKSEQKTVTK